MDVTTEYGTQNANTIGAEKVTALSDGSNPMFHHLYLAICKDWFESMYITLH